MLKILTIAVVATLAKYAIADVGPLQLNFTPYVLQHNVPSETSIIPAKSSEFVSVIKDVVNTLIAMLSNLIKNVLVFTLNNTIIVLASSLITVALCGLTKACAYINSISPFRQIQIAIKYMATPSRIIQVADFVHEAIKKYAQMQKI